MDNLAIAHKFFRLMRVLGELEDLAQQIERRRIAHRLIRQMVPKDQLIYLQSLKRLNELRERFRKAGGQRRIDALRKEYADTLDDVQAAISARHMTSEKPLAAK